jgi:ribosome-binding protein aMBF1 (putative translation factor)
MDMDNQSILDHQDWKTVVLRSKKKDTEKNKVPRKSGTRLQKFEKMADNDELKHKKVDQAMKTKVQQGRLALKLTQKQLAQRCNVQEQVIKDIESGKANYNPRDMNKIKRVLNIKH